MYTSPLRFTSWEATQLLKNLLMISCQKVSSPCDATGIVSDRRLTHMPHVNPLRNAQLCRRGGTEICCTVSYPHKEP